MTNEASEKVIELIKRCLALSESSNEHEAALAAAKAQELLDKYNLDLSAIQGSPDAGNIVQEYMRTGSQPKPGISYRWRTDLACAVASSSFVKILTSADGRAVFFIGQAHNIAATKATYEWLVEALERIADQAALAKKGTEGYRRSSDLRRFRNSFLQGAVLGVWTAMNAQRKERAENVQSLVVVNDEAIREWIDNKYEHLRPDACQNRKCRHMESKHELRADGTRGACKHEGRPGVRTCKCPEFTDEYQGREKRTGYNPESRRKDHAAWDQGYKAGQNVPLRKQEQIR